MAGFGASEDAWETLRENTRLTPFLESARGLQPMADELVSCHQILGPCLCVEKRSGKAVRGLGPKVVVNEDGVNTLLNEQASNAPIIFTAIIRHQNRVVLSAPNYVVLIVAASLEFVKVWVSERMSKQAKAGETVGGLPRQALVNEQSEHDSLWDGALNREDFSFSLKLERIA